MCPDNWLVGSTLEILWLENMKYNKCRKSDDKLTGETVWSRTTIEPLEPHKHIWVNVRQKSENVLMLE